MVVHFGGVSRFLSIPLTSFPNFGSSFFLFLLRLRLSSELRFLLRFLFFSRVPVCRYFLEISFFYRWDFCLMSLGSAVFSSCYWSRATTPANETNIVKRLW